MRLLTFESDQGLHLGIVTQHVVIDLTATAREMRIEGDFSPDGFYRMGLDAIPQIQSIMAQTVPTIHIHKLPEIKLGAAVPNPGKILCVGLNYRKHAAESGMAEPSVPVLFSKFSNAIAAPDEMVPMSLEWKTVDYEAELAVIIGKTARHVSEDEALDYVLGYANANDLSERDLQLKQPGGQWLLGKTLDKFLPLGPYVVTADEAGDPQDMPVKGWLNGELRQDSNTADMIFSVAQVIAYASRYFTLQPGDVISTGTPEGVILGMEPKVYMQPGDEYVVEIGNLGRLANRMVEA